MMCVSCDLILGGGVKRNIDLLVNLLQNFLTYQVFAGR
jgi:hypothetical protein